jgi:cardiolipin synthase A/B
MTAETSSLRELRDQAFSRTLGAELIPGNRVTLLKDAAENYPAWIEAMESAREWIHFETYIIHEDDMGRQFSELFIRKAAEGVEVRVLYDWVGSLGNASRKFWKRLSNAGVDIRCFNPPGLESPFGWLSRDHRKTIAVDGRIGFVSGLCVGQRWAGIPEKGLLPWRDTGIQIEGPAVTQIEDAFAEAWAAAGDRLPAREIPSGDPVRAVDDVSVRIVATTPHVGGIYRLDQLAAATARESIWLSDAYFIGTGAYVQALGAAARSGVDVRLLLPGANDVPIMRAVSRAGLRPLLEAGVRVYEWNGSMMHAKTAVVDARWARVGSTNLNVLSWLGNWELDVVVDDRKFARQMAEMYIEDLSGATEIVLTKRRRRPIAVLESTRARGGKRRAAAVSRTAAGVMRIGRTVGAAIANRRELGPAEATIMLWAAALLAVIAVVAIIWPQVVVVPFAVICLWTALSLLVRSYKLKARQGRGSRKGGRGRA